MTDNVLLNKAALIERCLSRIKEEYETNKEAWKTNNTVQDSILLNLQRACESVIDVANYVVKKKKLGIPQNSREAFDLLASAKLIDSALATRMKKMIGFRNLAVHEYQSLNLDIVESIIKSDLGDFSDFTNTFIKFDA